jgi:hypothetical protein
MKLCIVLYRGGFICTLYDLAILEANKRKSPIGISLSEHACEIIMIIRSHYCTSSIRKRLLKNY